MARAWPQTTLLFTIKITFKCFIQKIQRMITQISRYGINELGLIEFNIFWSCLNKAGIILEVS